MRTVRASGISVLVVRRAGQILHVIGVIEVLRARSLTVLPGVLKRLVKGHLPISIHRDRSLQRAQDRIVDLVPEQGARELLVDELEVVLRMRQMIDSAEVEVDRKLRDLLQFPAQLTHPRLFADMNVLEIHVVPAKKPVVASGEFPLHEVQILRHIPRESPVSPPRGPNVPSELEQIEMQYLVRQRAHIAGREKPAGTERPVE